MKTRRTSIPLQLSFLSCLTVLLLVGGCTDQEAVSIDYVSQYSLTGVVVEQVGSAEQPIQNAVVRLDSISTTTNASGRFAFTDVPAGTYKLTVTKTGYLPIDSTITISSDADLRIRIHTPTPRMFNYPASVGKSWVYKGSYSQVVPRYVGGGWWSYEEQIGSGIQTWLVENVSVQGADTLVYLTSARRDTVRFYNYLTSVDSGRIVTLDSTFLADANIPFSIRLSSDSISVNFHLTLHGYWGNSPIPNVENFSRTLGASSDTVTASSAHYVSGVGLIDCVLLLGANTFQATERLDLSK